MHDWVIEMWGKVLGNQNNSPKREVSLHSDTDDNLQNEYVVKCQLRSCLWETGAVKQWGWEWEWVSFYQAGPGSRWTPSCPKRWFQKKAEKDEIRKKKERDFWRRKAQDKDTEKAALANGPSSQLTQSEINSRVLQGSMANHQAWLPNTLT